MRLMIRAVAVLFAAAAILIAVVLALGGWQLVRVALGPVLPSSAATDDALYFRATVLANERSGSAAQRIAFDAFSREIVARRASLDDEALSLQVAQALALFDNAHTHVTDSRLRRLPLRFHWFADGLYVVKVRPQYESLLGARVVSIEDTDPEDLLQQLRPFLPGVEGWRRYRSEYFLSAPATLRELGASTDANSTVFEFRKRGGAAVTLAIPVDAKVPPSDAFREFRHLLPLDASFGTEGWLRLADGVEPKPLYLRDMPSPYALTWLEKERALYVRLDGSVNTRQIDLPTFLEQARHNVVEHHAKYAIVDLRFNWGGGYELTREFSADLAKALPADGKVFIITGPNTFSAGLIMAARLAHFAGPRAVIVGEPLGDRLQFWAEGLQATLPRSQVEIYLTTAAHDFKDGCRLFDQDCFILDKFMGVAVGELAPRVTARNTFDDFVSGRDQAMARILEIIARSAA
jgi:hypothetical protein